jgi:hypothetical protein
MGIAVLTPRDELPARPARLTRGRGLAHSAAVSRSVDGLVRWGAQRRWPVLTTVALVVACAAAVVQYTVPAAVPALERTPSGLPRGEYWRLVTPLLVQTLGWYQVLANLATLAVIGAVTEWVLGCRWWLTLVIAGTAGGQLAAYHWHEWGGGDSIAICGLAAGVLVTQLVGRDPPVRWAADAVLYYIVALAGWGLVGIVGAGLAVVAAVAGLWLVRRIDPAGGYRLALAATGLGALGLAALRDLHGAALTAAMLLSAIVLICRNWVGSSG